MDVRIFPPEEMLEATVALPYSKSMYNRALLMNALTPGASPVDVPSPCDDGDVMLAALQSGGSDINIGASGTAMRFLTAYYAATEGADVTLDGIERMRMRPIGVLVDALRSLGADIEYAGAEGFPPLRIRGRRLHGGSIDVDAQVSSQFISALMMVAPTFSEALEINLKGEISSLPYIKMTLGMMEHRGVDVELYNDVVTIKPGTYSPLQDSDIERDWSASSYWYSIAAISAGWVTLPGMKLPSLQGDSRLAEIYEMLGVVTSESEDEPGSLELSASPEVFSRLEADLSDTPDIVQTVVVTCCMIGVPFVIWGVKSLRIKETDRLAALQAELRKLAIDLEIRSDNEIRWDGRRGRMMEIPKISTYGDHRMAMAFAPASIFIPGLQICDAEVVSKSYPGFWDDMSAAGFKILDAAALPDEPQEAE